MIFMENNIKISKLFLKLFFENVTTFMNKDNKWNVQVSETQDDSEMEMLKYILKIEYTNVVHSSQLFISQMHVKISALTNKYPKK